jgi:hypothetical protein
MRIGHAAGTPGGAHTNARDAYLEHCLHIAAQLAAGDEQAQQRVREARQRWAPSPIAGS